MPDREAQQHGEEHDERGDEEAQRLDDGGVTQEREDPLDQHRQNDEDHLGRVARVETSLDHQHETGPDDEDEAFDLEPDLGDPVEERDRS